MREDLPQERGGSDRSSCDRETTQLTSVTSSTGSRSNGHPLFLRWSRFPFLLLLFLRFVARFPYSSAELSSTSSIAFAFLFPPFEPDHVKPNRSVVRERPIKGERVRGDSLSGSSDSEEVPSDSESTFSLYLTFFVARRESPTREDMSESELSRRARKKREREREKRGVSRKLEFSRRASRENRESRETGSRRD